MDSYFSGVGVPVMQVYGAAETAGVFTANAPGERVPGTVGKAMPGREVWVSREGELYVRGGAVFSGYWADGEGSRAAFREGWLATGVLAEVDNEGYVRVRERLRPQASMAQVPGRFVPRGPAPAVEADPVVLREPAERAEPSAVTATAALPLAEAPTRELEVASAVEEPVERRGSPRRCGRGRVSSRWWRVPAALPAPGCFG